MTAQIYDQITIDGVELTVPEGLSVPSRPEIEPTSHPTMSALWRGYIARWEVRDDQLFLADLGAGLRLRGGPLVADWITTVVDVGEGEPIDEGRWDDATAYHTILQLDVVCGRVRRRRRVIAPRGRVLYPGGRVWEALPGWRELGLASARILAREVDDGLPHAVTFRDAPLRRRVTAMRERERINAAAWAARLGLSTRRAHKLVEWERGQRELTPELLAAMRAALGLGEEERRAMLEEARAELARAWKAWAEQPRPPLVFIDRDLSLYEAAPEYKDGARAEALAQKCAELAWRPTVALPDRITAIHVDALGAVVQRVHREMPSLEEAAP